MDRDEVEVLPRNGKFLVIVKEDGKISEREFEFEHLAQAWADHQHIRMMQTNRRPSSPEK